MNDIAKKKNVLLQTAYNVFQLSKFTLHIVYLLTMEMIGVFILLQTNNLQVKTD